MMFVGLRCEDPEPEIDVIVDRDPGDENDYHEKEASAPSLDPEDHDRGYN